MPRLTFLLPVLVLVSALSARAAMAEEGPRIGVVDFQRALNEVDEGAEAKNKLKTEFEQKQKTLDERQEKLKTARDELEARGATMKAELKEQKQRQLQQDFMELQQLYMQMQQELSAKESEITGGIFQKMGVILAQIGRESDYTLVVEKSTVLYAKSHLDLTNEVIRRYNDAYGKKPAAAKKPAGK